jgi:DNA (cytosine-5)-methyltransferase 1
MNKISAKMVPVIHETVGTLCADSHPGSYTGQDAYTGRLVPQPIPLNSMNCFRSPDADPSTGCGIGDAGEAMFTITKTNSHAVAQPIPFDTTQITSKANYSKPQQGDPCHPLAAGAHPPAIAQTLAVRRLTCTECERLQGFPDGYTNIPWRKADESPDGPRYKALGNSMAVPVMAWIGKRIQEVESL